VCGTTLLASLVADLVFLPALIMLVRQVWPARQRANEAAAADRPSTS
jgi:hypothetical protein